MIADPNSEKPNLTNLQPTVHDFTGQRATPARVESPAPPDRSTWRRFELYGCFLLMAVAIQLIAGPKVQLSQWGMRADSNAAVAEGIAWTKGRLDIPPVKRQELQWDYTYDESNRADPENRLHDSAIHPTNGRLYNVFPPLVSILTWVLAPVHALLGMPEGIWRPEFMALLIYWPLAVATFVVFYRRIGHPLWAAALGVAFIGGTAVLPNLQDSGQGFLGQLDHVLSQVGLLIVVGDLLGRQRIWPALIGLTISTYTRQITFLYGLVLLWFAWRRFGPRGVVLTGLGLAAIASPLLTLNFLKFGSPLDFGYRHIYVGREADYMGSRCVRYGTFSWKFILGVDDEPGNLYYMHLAPPSLGTVTLVSVDVQDLNQSGTSLWITTPLAFWVLIAARRWWREPTARALMMGTIPIMIGLSMYHSPGYVGHGYNRFALDFLPIWLVVVAPYAIGGRHRWRSWLTAAFAAWGLLYFHMVVPEARLNLAVTHGEV